MKGIIPTATIVLLGIFAGTLGMLYVTGITNPTNLPLVNITDTNINWELLGNLTVDGSVGINTTNPTSLLHVSGNANITGTLLLTNLSGTGNAYVCVNANGILTRSSTACT